MHTNNARLASLTVTAVCLASILDPGRQCTVSSSPRSRVIGDIVVIEAVCDLYAKDHDGAYPDDLARLIEPDAAGERLLITTTIPLDPWRRPYLYEPTDEPGARPRIGTLGRDGVPGGEGDDRDVDNRMLRADFEAR